MLNPADMVMRVVQPILVGYAEKGIEYSAEKLREMLQSVMSKVGVGSGEIDIDSMTESLRTLPTSIGRESYGKETLARILEIPLEELAVLNPEMLDVDQIISHVKLESEFEHWLEEWGYSLEEAGYEIAGAHDVDFITDVYGELVTLHGKFIVAVSLVCDAPPPDEDRILAILNKLDACSAKWKNEGTSPVNHIFIIATPHNFSHTSANAISLQNNEEDYALIALEGLDIHTLETATSKESRRQELWEKVERAQDATRRKNHR